MTTSVPLRDILRRLALFHSGAEILVSSASFVLQILRLFPPVADAAILQARDCATSVNPSIESIALLVLAVS
jgi:hypothetical protein